MTFVKCLPVVQVIAPAPSQPYEPLVGLSPNLTTTQVGCKCNHLVGIIDNILRYLKH